jgi:hypothetical protein
MTKRIALIATTLFLVAGVVLATGSDGYQALVAYGEIDPGFGAKEVLLAISQDDVSLADAGPRLVVPGDKRGGRYVSNVVRVRLDRGR